MDDTGCPEPGCYLPAEILDRTVLESTDGPVEHARVACVGGHRFLMPTAMLPERRDLAPDHRGPAADVRRVAP